MNPQTKFAKSLFSSAPESCSILSGMIGATIDAVSCHHLPGQDGRLLDTIEISTTVGSRFLRAPRAERISRTFPAFKHFPIEEFVFSELPIRDRTDDERYHVISDNENLEWKSIVGERILAIESLVKTDGMVMQGIRFNISSSKIANYHFQWGDSPGELVSAEIGLTIGLNEIPHNVNWQYIPLLPPLPKNAT